MGDARICERAGSSVAPTPGEAGHTPDAEACCALKEGRWGDAERLLLEVLANSPDCTEAHTGLGVSLAHLGRMDEAREHLLAAVRTDPSNTAACYNLGWVHQQSRDYAAALSWYRDVVMADAGDSDAYTRMAECALALGRVDDAEAFYLEAFRLAPDSLDAALGLGQLYLAQEELLPARDVLNLALQRHPDDVALGYTLGLVLELRGQYRDALPLFHAAVIQNPHSAEGFLHLGRCASLAGLAEEAEAFLAQAVRLQPDSVETLFELGRHYSEAGQLDQAIGAFEECLRRVEETAAAKGPSQGDDDSRARVGALNALGLCYRERGDVDRARGYWTRSLAADPTQDHVREWLADSAPLYRRRSLTF